MLGSCTSCTNVLQGFAIMLRGFDLVTDMEPSTSLIGHCANTQYFHDRRQKYYWNIMIRGRIGHLNINIWKRR